MPGFRERMAKFGRRLRRRRALTRVERFPRHPRAPLHRLDGQLIVSLTSYPPRFPTLALTLKSLLDQTVRPDATVLWIAEADLARLPPEVGALEAHGLSIRGCEDVGSFKKILPALRAYPDAFVAIADDDSHYPDDWLESLVDGYDPAEPTIVAHRAHRLAYGGDGRLAPYREWPRDVSDPASARPSDDLLPTGNGGVLYPPGSLPPLALDGGLRRRLSPTCDDTWLFFLARLAGTRVRRTRGARSPLVEWADTQDVSLRKYHRQGQKDAIIAALADHFGTP